jgi:hypothetical protein
MLFIDYQTSVLLTLTWNQKCHPTDTSSLFTCSAHIIPLLLTKSEYEDVSSKPHCPCRKCTWSCSGLCSQRNIVNARYLRLIHQQTFDKFSAFRCNDVIALCGATSQSKRYRRKGVSFRSLSSSRLGGT